MFWQSQNLFINKWMPADEYGRTSAFFTGAYLFVCLGFILSGTVFADPDVDVKASLNSLILYCNFAITAIFLFFIFTF